MVPAFKDEWWANWFCSHVSFIIFRWWVVGCFLQFKSISYSNFQKWFDELLLLLWSRAVFFFFNKIIFIHFEDKRQTLKSYHHQDISMALSWEEFMILKFHMLPFDPILNRGKNDPKLKQMNHYVSELNLWQEY